MKLTGNATSLKVDRRQTSVITYLHVGNSLRALVVHVLQIGDIRARHQIIEVVDYFILSYGNCTFRDKKKSMCYFRL